MTRTVSRLALVLGGLAVASAASASTTSEDSFSYNGTEFAMLSWTSDATSTSFSLDFLSAPNNGAYVKSFEFNGPNGTFMDTDSTTTSTGTFGSFSKGGFDYTWNVTWPKSGSGAFKPGETATWTIANAGPYVPDMPILTIGNYGGQTISVCGDVVAVPEPSTSALLLAGLGGLGLLARRRQSRG